MTLRSAAAVLSLAAAAVAIAFAASLFGPAGRRGASALPGRAEGASGTPAYGEARARARAYPFYRSLFARGAVRSAAPLPGGAIALTVDLRVAARSALARKGLQGLESGLPSAAAVEIRAVPGGVAETWRFPCADGCLFDAFAPGGGGPPSDAAAAAVAGISDAVAVFRLAPERFRDLAVGPRAQRVLRDRLALIEAIVGRPVRDPAAEDLTGAGAIAFYRDPEGGPERALLTFDLARTDRVRSLLDLVLGLGALTRGAAVHRHREVPIGAFTTSRPGLAAAVDGPLLLVASDPVRIEDAIDRRRDPAPLAAAAPGLPSLAGASLRLRGSGGVEAALTREGDAWRLEARGPQALADSVILSSWLSLGTASAAPGTY